jgi:hypothetical protein
MLRQVYDERIHLSAKGLIITLAGASDEFAGIIHGKLSTASNFNRREGVQVCSRAGPSICKSIAFEACMSHSERASV